jgi:hypothetical protein
MRGRIMMENYEENEKEKRRISMGATKGTSWK